MPVSDPPPAPTVVIRRNPARRAAEADEPLPPPFVPGGDLEVPPEIRGVEFRTVNAGPLNRRASAQPQLDDVDSLRTDTTAVSGLRGALRAAWNKHRDKLAFWGAGTLVGALLFGLGYTLGASRRPPPAEPTAKAIERPPMPAVPAAPPATAQAKPPAEPPQREPAPASSTVEPAEKPAALPLPSATGRSITSLALETPAPTDRRVRARAVAAPPKTVEAPAKTAPAAEPPPAPPPVAAKEPDPFSAPPPPPPAASAPRKGHVSPIQAPGF